MIREAILIFVLFLCSVFYSKAQSLTGIKWVDINTHCYLELSSNRSYGYYDTDRVRADSQFYQNEYDTLSFFRSYINFSGELKFDTSIYKIIYLRPDTLMLKFAAGERLRYGVDTLTFVNHLSLFDSVLDFKRLYLSSTTYLGICRDFKMEIFSDGTIYFLGKQYTGRYKGLYKGRMDETQLNHLIDILKRSGMSTFPRGNGIGTDAPVIHFIVDYSDSRLNFIGSSFPPYNSELESFLFLEYKNWRLRRSWKRHFARMNYEETAYYLETEKITTP